MAVLILNDVGSVLSARARNTISATPEKGKPRVQKIGKENPPGTSPASTVIGRERRPAIWINDIRTA